MHATRSRWSVLIALLAAFAVALPPGAPGAVYTTVDSAASVNWNTAPWNPVEPPGVDQRVGLLRGGGVMEVNTVETAGGLLVGWTGTYTVNMTGGSLTLGSAPNDNALYVSENTGGQGTFNHSGGTVDTPSVVFNRNGAANNGAYTLSGTALLRTGSVARPQGTATFNFNGGTLQATAGGTDWFAAGITANVQAGGAVIDTQNFDVTVNSALLNGGGGGGLTKLGSGVLRLAGTNTYTGLTTVSGGTLQIGTGTGAAPLGAATFFVGAPATLVFHGNADNNEFTTQSIGGAGDVVFRGQQTGYFTFRNAYSGTLSYTGRTIVNLDDNPGNQWYQGTLWLEKDNVFSTASVLEMQSGKIYIRNSGTLGQTVAGLTGNAGTFITTDQGVQKLNINVAAGQSYTYAGVIGADGTGTGNNNVALTKSGAGTQILTGPNTYTGGTTVNDGVLQIGNGGTAGVLPGNVTLNTPGNLTFNRSDLVTFGGNTSGTGSLTQAGSGTLVVTGALNHSGGTTVSGGTLQFGVNSPAGVRPPGTVTLQNGANLAFSHNYDYAGISVPNVTGNGNLVLLGQGGGYYSIRPGQTTTLNYSGVTTLQLDSQLGSSYRGALFVEPGSVGLPSTTVLNIVSGKLDLRQNQTIAGLTGTGGYVTTDGAGGSRLIIDFASSAGPFTYGGVIGAPPEVGYNSANVGLEKRGTGTQILTGANNYTGGTTVTAGRLLAQNATGSATGTGLVTVSGGALGGGNAAGTTGFIGGPVLITGTGALAPGNSPGILTLQNGLTFTGGAYSIEIQGNVAGTLYDQTKVTAGNVALGGGVADLLIDSTGYTPGAADLLWIINNVGTGSTTGFFAGLPEGSVVRIAQTNFAIHYGANYGLGQLTGGNDVALAFVPEPSTLVLMALGGAALLGALQRWTRRRHAKEA